MSVMPAAPICRICGPNPTPLRAIPAWSGRSKRQHRGYEQTGSTETDAARPSDFSASFGRVPARVLFKVAPGD